MYCLVLYDHIFPLDLHWKKNIETVHRKEERSIWKTRSCCVTWCQERVPKQQKQTNSNSRFKQAGKSHSTNSKKHFKNALTQNKLLSNVHLVHSLPWKHKTIT